MTKKKAKKKAIKKKRPATQTPPQAGPPKIVPYPDAGKKIIDFEQKLNGQLAGEPAQQTRGRGRPRKEDQPEPEFAMTENLIAEGLKTPFELWAISQKLDELKLQDKEAVTLAASVKQLLDYYLPNVPMIAIAWASLAITTKSIMAPRLALIAELKKQKQAIASSAQPGDKDKGQGGPRPSASPAIRVGTTPEFPQATEPVKI